MLKQMPKTGWECFSLYVCACSHLIANDINLVLHLGNPLTDDGKQLWDSCPRIHEDLQTCRVIGVKEGERCKQEKPQEKTGNRF